MSVIYGQNEYTLSEFMKCCELFKACSEENIFQLHLSMFESEFKLLNSGKFDVTKYNTVDEINYIYDVLGYFGIESLIIELNEHVYFLEIIRLQIDDDDFFVNCIKLLLSKNTKLSELFFERRLHIVHWEVLCRNTNISEEFFQRHLDSVQWLSLCKNTNISEEFLQRPYIEIDKYCIIEKHFVKTLTV